MYVCMHVGAPSCKNRLTKQTLKFFRGVELGRQGAEKHWFSTLNIGLRSLANRTKSKKPVFAMMFATCMVRGVYSRKSDSLSLPKNLAFNCKTAKNCYEFRTKVANTAWRGRASPNFTSPLLFTDFPLPKYVLCLYIHIVVSIFISDQCS